MRNDAVFIVIKHQVAKKNLADPNLTAFSVIFFPYIDQIDQGFLGFMQQCADKKQTLTRKLSSRRLRISIGEITERKRNEIWSET
jgi:hypothetical protein